MAEIVVLAGTNGAGKSSVAGEYLRAAGMPYFNPDEATGDLLAEEPGLSAEEANAIAWEMGRRGLEAAITTRTSYAFETTLGGSTITRLLLKASNVGLPVRMWYVGLQTVDLHIKRIAARVRRGGHDIPETRVRQRYDDSRRNLLDLLPHLAELKVVDNSTEGDPVRRAPRPLLVIHVREGRIMAGCSLAEVSDWAKPVVLRALELFSESIAMSLVRPRPSH